MRGRTVSFDSHYDQEKLQPWMQKVYYDLCIHCTVPPVPALTDKQIKLLALFGFRLLYIPAIKEEYYPQGFVRPAWGEYLETRLIEHWTLPGRWLAVETLAKPHWFDPARYPDDQLARAIKLKSRFNVGWAEVQEKFIPRMAKVVGVPEKSVRLPSAEEWNFIGNLFNWLRRERQEKLPHLGSTNSWEWCANVYKGNGPLIMGFRDSGGLSAVYGNTGPDQCIGFRVVIAL